MNFQRILPLVPTNDINAMFATSGEVASNNLNTRVQSGPDEIKKKEVNNTDRYQIYLKLF